MNEEVISQSTEPSVNPTYKKFQPYFAGPLILAMAIVETCAAVFALIQGQIDVFSILLAIALWVIYISSANKNFPTSITGQKMVSGITKAHMIVSWVVAGITFVSAFITCAGGILVNGVSNSIINDAVTEALASLEKLYPEEVMEIVTSVLSNGVGFLLIAITIALFLLTGVMVMFALFFRKSHMFTKSICIGLETGAEPDIKKVKFTTTFILVMSILNSVELLNVASNTSSDINSIYATVSSLCSVAFGYLAFAWLKQAFASKKGPEVISEPADKAE